MGSKKKVKKKVAKKKAVKKVTKKVASRVEEDRYAQPHNEIDDGFAAISKEYTEFKQQKINFYREQGIEIDVTSHEAHWQKVFIMGKLAVLAGLTKKQGETINVQANKKRTTNKKRSTARASESQLELGL